uniref:uncharacterized protein LOC118545450 n=1 Tax=Halichoerus grypus TaxID=9711 RepID=UPI001659A5CF|nr:uncharacterized protein LOC118545450 [Halichoerus grypus]
MALGSWGSQGLEIADTGEFRRGLWDSVSGVLGETTLGPRPVPKNYSKERSAFAAGPGLSTWTLTNQPTSGCNGKRGGRSRQGPQERVAEGWNIPDPRPFSSVRSRPGLREGDIHSTFRSSQLRVPSGHPSAHTHKPTGHVCQNNRQPGPKGTADIGLVKEEGAALAEVQSSAGAPHLSGEGPTSSLTGLSPGLNGAPTLGRPRPMPRQVQSHPSSTASLPRWPRRTWPKRRQHVYETHS